MTRASTRAAVWGVVLILVASLGSTSADALGDDPKAGESVTQYLTPAILEAVFPGADKVGEVDGSPPAAAVYRGGRQVGYLFSTWDVTQSKGFSNRPVVLLVGVDLTGHVTAARLVHHTEPIAILGLKDEQLHAFVENYRGHDLNAGVDIVSDASSSVLGAQKFSQRSVPSGTALVKIDAVSRATTSSVLISDAIVRGARIVARSRGLLHPLNPGAARLDVDRFAPADWPELEATGAIGHLHLSYGDVRGILGSRAGPVGDPAAAPGDTFLDLYVSLVSVAGIGVNVLGQTWYGQYTVGRGADDLVILIAANGRYSILGDDWEHADIIGRVQLVQDDKTIRLSAKQVKSLPFLHARKAPDLTERALVFFSGDHGLDPTRPWQLRLLVSGEAAGDLRSFASFDLAYRVPESYVLKAVAPAGSDRDAIRGGESPAPDRALPWRQIWSAHGTNIAILGLGLTALTVILFRQDDIARRRRLHRLVRVGFLAWTLVWLGWYAGAQLTVINLITYVHTVVTDWRWDYLLADPLLTILSVFTLAGLFIWGRAIFCGWLCPFGALQELANNLAQRLGVPQIAVPMALHGRLVAIKYVVFVGLLAVSFVSWDLAMAGAEIEPFKAAIILRFMTEWPMATYALALVLASLFVERFYCRFACPLGGGLAILGRVRMFSRLKRHPECGARCRLCESVCPVGAIRRNGEIDMNECFYCLDCQVTYYDDHICPPMVWRRRQRSTERGAVHGVPP
jgi:NosR/NirI family transcriptional regulator, nitrous oxide reductase regulator